MRIEKLIQFDRKERSVIETARRSLPIAHRDGNFGVDPEFEDASRSLGAIMSGNATGKLLERAEGTLVDLLQAIQMDRVHFLGLRDNPPPPEKVTSGGGVPVITNLHEMAKTLVEAREVQQAEVTDALMLVRKARKLADEAAA